MRVLRKGPRAVSSTFLVVGAVLALAAGLGVVPTPDASATSTSVSIVLPSEGATLSGSQWFDAVPNGSGDTGVRFELTPGRQPSGPCAFEPGQPGCLIGDATLTWVGWAVRWNTENVPNGQYDVIATVQPSYAQSLVSVTVNNQPPTVALPADNSTLSGTQWLDCAPPPGVSQVVFWAESGANTPQLLGTGAISWVGWLYNWTTSGVPNGTYSLFCSGTYPEGGSAPGPPITITVSN